MFSRNAEGFRAGDIKAHGRSALPAGWLWCDGSAVSRATYAALFAAISTAFGVGNGSTTFNVPDLRGRVPAGKDDMGSGAASRLTAGGSGVSGATLGAVGGAQTVTLTEATTGPHSHAQQGYGDIGGSAVFTTGSSSPSTTVTTSSAGGGSAHNNIPPVQVFNYIVKA